MPDFRVGKPRCRLVLTADRPLAAGNNNVVWDAATYDDVGGWDGNDSYQFDRDGYWLFGVTTKFSAVSPAAIGRTSLLLNGVAVSEVSSISSTALKPLTLVDMLEVAEGDVLHVQVNNNPSTASLILASMTRLTLTRIGPKSWR